MKERPTSQAPGNSVDRFFESVLAAKPDLENLEQANRLANVLLRNRMLEESFVSDKALACYLKQAYPHFTQTQLDETLGEIVSENAYLVDLISAKDGRKYDQEDANSQYMALVNAGYVDPSIYFPDIPAPELLCGLKDLFERVREDPKRASEIAKQLQTVAAFTSNRYETITGRPLSFSRLPFLSELVSLKGPVPWQSAWSSKWYGAEAECLNLKPRRSSAGAGSSGDATQPETSTARAGVIGTGPTTVSQPGASAGDPAASEEDPDIQGGNGESGAAEAGAANADSSECSMDELYQLAGSNPPRQPGEKEPRYTFPGRLNTGEDIFYDYAVILPIRDCEGLQQPPQYEPRDLDASILLVSKARGVLAFLDRMHLKDSLGITREADPSVPNSTPHYFFDDIKALLQNVQNLQIQPTADVDDIRFWRRKLKSMAGTLRTIAKTEVNLVPLDLPDLQQQKDALVAALNAVPDYDLNENEPEMQEERTVRTRRRTSTYSRPEKKGKYLYFPGAHPDPRNLGYVDLHPGQVRLGGKKWYMVDPNAQLRHTRWYLNFLGSTFHDSLEKLKSEINSFVAIVESIKNPASQFREDFKNLAIELVYQAIFALAKLIDEICENLSLDRAIRTGTKRLALMLVYRQHWYPAGYVQGKLVGYKNLAPNQSERIHRRTFVKTRTETSQAQEFVATRQQDYSQTSKETAEFLKESSQRFNFTSSANGNFSFGIGSFGVTASSSLDLAKTSRATHSQIAEMTNSGSVSYNEKREVNISELLETEVLEEVTTEIKNDNQEITANYFYYQLLRQYKVVTEMFDLKPVLLRAREVPITAEVDERFIANNAHLLIPALPLQLGADVQDTVHRIDGLSRAVLRTRTVAEQKRSAYEIKRKETPPQDPQLLSQWQSELTSMERDASESWAAYVQEETQYLDVRSRLDRVVTHVRKNICFYMQYIWQGSPSVDENKLIAKEKFAGYSLPLITRGLTRIGFHGNEEIFEYDGPSLTLLEVMLRHMKSGREIVKQKSLGVTESSTYQLLARKYHTGDNLELLKKISNHAFVVDPTDKAKIMNERMVQLAQNALVVETMPGQIPLLEGFKMAHRMLDVQQACLENRHLRARIADRPWSQGGEDSYRVYRREGQPLPDGEEG